MKTADIPDETSEDGTLSGAESDPCCCCCCCDTDEECLVEEPAAA